MVDRLASLRAGTSIADISEQAIDLEAGLNDEETNNLLSEFNKEIRAIENVIEWGNRMITTSKNSDKYDRTQQLEEIEVKVVAVRRRLKAMAEKNRTFAREHARRPATVRTRIVRYTKCTNDFIALTELLSDAQDEQRRELAAVVKNDVMTMNPSLNENSIDAAIESGEQKQLDRVLSSSNTTAEMQQLEDVRLRNRELQKLVLSVSQLNDIFQDMSLLVSTQQELINEIEFIQEEVQQNHQHANEQLESAHGHLKRTKKMKIWCIILLVVILLIVALSIVLSITLSPKAV